MGIDRQHLHKTVLKRHQPGSGLESTREEESREAKIDLEEEH